MAYKIYLRLRSVLWKIKIVFLVWATLVTFTFAFILYATCATSPKYDPVKQTVVEMIGKYSDYDAGRRDAIQHIAAQMQRYPKARRYTARYYEVGWNGETRRLIYDRDEKQLLRGNVPCGCIARYDNVTENMIQEVAAMHGSMSDFKKLGGIESP